MIFYMDGVYRNTQDRLRELMKHPYIGYDLLWAFFKPGYMLITRCPDTNAWRAVQYVSGKYGSNAFKLQCRFHEFKEDELGEASLELRIPAFDGQRPIRDLEVSPPQYHPNTGGIWEALMSRGAKFLALQGAHHKYFSGVAKPMLTDDPDIRMKGKIIVDPTAYYTERSYPYPFEADHRTNGTRSIDWNCLYQFRGYDVAGGSDFNDLDPEYVNVRTLNGTPISTQDGAQDGTLEPTLEKNRLLLCPPTIIGYALEHETWC